MELVRKYELSEDGKRREWSVIGPYGALSFWCEETTPESRKVLGEEYYGGVENHYNAVAKPEYLNDASHRADCHLVEGGCWHAGTSLWASERWIPYVLPYGNECIFAELEHYYEDRMKPEPTP